MVRIRDETNTTTLFQFGGKEKVLRRGSLIGNFTSKIKRNPRLNSKDILHKKGISNRVLPFDIKLWGTDRFTNYNILEALATAQTTIYLDTEGLKDEWNGKYDFIDDWIPNIDEKWSSIELKFKLIENIN